MEMEDMVPALLILQVSLGEIIPQQQDGGAVEGGGAKGP